MVEERATFGGSLRWNAIWRSALSVATFALPIGITQQWLRDSDRMAADSPMNFVFIAAILFCATLGGFGAAKLAPEHPLPNGAAAGALAYLGVQLVGLVRRLAVGEDVSNPLGWIYLALLMATMGMAGAALERRSRPLRETPSRPADQV